MWKNVSHLASVLLLASTWLVCQGHDKSGHYINQFVVEIKGGELEAKKLAEDLGFTYHQPVSNYTIIYTWLIILEEWFTYYS